ncbi:hypothetical protein [Paludisphaera borealis]|uniref:Uncharacterized protein n=1 Tax=Paludisphaera borealis TaxID=1387353 RepID=A0A1U7CMM5_9BACT|nr:hypothetical protein [Paludisphaera borealis]APW60190.1 hypothetical protein BSF38_01656 [Paludisphaera borealis]
MSKPGSSQDSQRTDQAADPSAQASATPVVVAGRATRDAPIGVAVSTSPGQSGVVTARKAGELRDMGLQVDPRKVGVQGALQHLAKAVNIAFQTDYGENYLESVYQAAVFKRGEVQIIHREYFGFGDTWFGQFGRLIRSMELTLEGPDPVSPEGRERIIEKGPSSIRGIFNLLGRKLDLVTEYEDRVPAYVEQMFDRLEASGIIVGWNRDDWDVWTTQIGLDIRIAPKEGVDFGG